MRFSPSALRAAWASRVASLPSQFIAPSPGREAVLEGARSRNALLDALFYDIDRVTPEEASAIAPHWAAEGSIVHVPPSGEGPLRLCRSIDELAAHDASVACLAVAGVGSSALGTAAFARNIADALSKPVAAVVSGYGLADVAAEALGGYFWFGMLNGTRHYFEGLDRFSSPSYVEDPDHAVVDSFADGLLSRSMDTRCVVSLLQDERFSFDFVCGHSKGNLVISEALYELGRNDSSRAETIGTGATFMTISARILMPKFCRRVVDVMGEIDWFGAMNSRPFLSNDYVVPGAWHHTNTELPMHLPVTKSVCRALAQFGEYQSS